MMRMTQATFVAFVLIAPILAGAAYGQSAPSTAEERQDLDKVHYQDCMSLALSHPKSALDGAKTWEGVGGGAPARHCALSALMQLGRYEAAARGLAKLSQEVQANTTFKTQLMLQSGAAWFRADKPDQTRRLADQVLALEPDNLKALLLRAKVLGSVGKFWEAADDLTRILYSESENVDALILRGSAYRHMGAQDLALKDITRALSLDGNNPDGLLEHGLVLQNLGDLAAAKTAWQALIKAHPNDEASQRAQSYLDKRKAVVQP